MKGPLGPVAAVVALGVALAGFPASPARAARVNVRGYVKDFFVVQDYPTLAGGPVLPSDVVIDLTGIADNVRCRVNLSSRLSGWLSADVSYNIVPRFQNEDAARALSAPLTTAGSVFETPSIYRVDDLRSTLAPPVPSKNDRAIILQNLDRAFLTVSAPWFDLYVGRQAIAWGSAHAVNPTDIIAPFLYTEIDTEDRIGVDAVRLRAPTGALGEVDMGYVMGRHAEWKNSAAYVRVKTFVAGSDAAATVMRVHDRLTMLGFDVTRPLAGAGVWTEAAWSTADGRGAASPHDDYWRVSTGFDYSFPNALYVFLEYHYNGPGAADPSDYDRALAGPAYTDGADYLLGRHYLIPGASYPMTPLVTVSGNVLLDMSDGSSLFAPLVEYNVLENVYLSAGAFVGAGAAPVLRATPGLTVAPRSEFGAYPDTYYLSARYYF